MIVGSRNVIASMPTHAAVALVLFGYPAALCLGQQPVSHTPTRSPRDWAVIASDNEARAITHEGSLLRYQVHTIDQKGERTREVLECTGGSVARMFRKDGKALTPEEDLAERDRLTDLLNSPAEYARHNRSEASEKKLAVDLVRLMPDAMTYSFGAAAQGTGGSIPRAADGGALIVLDFTPNPSWNPPTTTSEALTGLRGKMWIDPQSGYVVRMEGEVFRPVNFGYGMVARVYPGGRLLLTQVGVGADRWIYSHFEEHIRIRALMFKTIDVNTSVDSANHQVVPGSLTWQQAIQALLASRP